MATLNMNSNIHWNNSKGFLDYVSVSGREGFRVIFCATLDPSSRRALVKGLAGAAKIVKSRSRRSCHFIPSCAAEMLPLHCNRQLKVVDQCENYGGRDSYCICLLQRI